MRLTIHTERGTYSTKSADLTPEEAEQLRSLIEKGAEDGALFEIETNTGYVVLSKGLLHTAAFVVEV